MNSKSILGDDYKGLIETISSHIEIKESESDLYETDPKFLLSKIDSAIVSIKTEAQSIKTKLEEGKNVEYLYVYNLNEDKVYLCQVHKKIAEFISVEDNRILSLIDAILK